VALFALATRVEFTQAVERAAFGIAEAAPDEDGEMVDAAVTVLVGGKVISVAVSDERTAMFILAGKDGRSAPNPVLLRESTVNAQQRAASGLGDGERIRHER